MRYKPEFVEFDKVMSVTIANKSNLRDNNGNIFSSEYSNKGDTSLKQSKLSVHLMQKAAVKASSGASVMQPVFSHNSNIHRAYRSNKQRFTQKSQTDQMGFNEAVSNDQLTSHSTY